MGVLVGIARRKKKRAPMETLERAEISTGTGVAGDSRGKPGKRQVTVLSAAAWRDACAELGKDVPWTTRRANLLVEGIELEKKEGAVLRIGGVELRVTGELDPCSRMDEQQPGLTRALQPNWRGGVTCAVLKGGFVAVGDTVAVDAVPAD